MAEHEKLLSKQANGLVLLANGMVNPGGKNGVSLALTMES